MAKTYYVDNSTISPWGSKGHCHLLAAYDLTIFHSFSYSAITDENVKNRLTTDINSNTTGDSEDALVDNSPCPHQFAALNVFVKNAISDVSETRANLGVIQNRLEHTIRNLDNIAENTTAAESSIRDTDMATEMIKYSSNNIIVQAGQTLLAQANQSKNGVLALLQ